MREVITAVYLTIDLKAIFEFVGFVGGLITIRQWLKSF
jgi:hypothetical protein